MLIVCSGPDTFRAQKKARDLEVAFKQKYDAQGLSVEHVSSGKEAVDEVAARAHAISLFAPRRFVRTVDLLASASKAQRGTLKRVLRGDQDGFILLSVEEEAPNASILKEFEEEVKIVRYDFPLLQGHAFMNWALEEAREMGFEDERSVQEVARATEGDSWSCFFELMKRAAFSGAELANRVSGEGTVFGFADAYMAGRHEWREVGERTDLVKQVLTTFASQARSAVRVRDGASEGIHPFVVRKLRGQHFSEIETRFAQVLEAFFLQRSGYADEKDGLTLL